MTTDNITLRAALEKTVKALEEARVDLSEVLHDLQLKEIDTALSSAARASVRAQGEDELRKAVATVLEGWTLPDAVRKILETAYWARPQAREPAPSTEEHIGDLVAHMRHLSTDGVLHLSDAEALVRNLSKRMAAPSTAGERAEVVFCYTFRSDQAASAYQSACDIDEHVYDRASFDVGYAQGKYDEQMAQGPDYDGDTPRAAILSAPALPVGELTDEQITAAWNSLGGIPQWLKTFGYNQFARAILAAARNQPERVPTDGPLQLHKYVNGADIGGNDMPAMVVNKLQASIDRAHGITKKGAA